MSYPKPKPKDSGNQAIKIVGLNFLDLVFEKSLIGHSSIINNFLLSIGSILHSSSVKNA
jgi:hypothetical protein